MSGISEESSRVTYPSEGRFQFEVLITELLRNDISEDKDAIADFFKSDIAITAAVQATMEDAARFGKSTACHYLSKFNNFPEHFHRTVFHERLHYWQFLSSPPLQSLFLSTLEVLKSAVHRRGGRDYRICAGYLSRTDSLVRPSLETWRLAARAALLPTKLTRDMVRSHEWISEIADFDFLRLHLPVGSENAVPAYGVAFHGTGYEDSELALTGFPLMEAAASVCQSLFRRELPKGLSTWHNESDLLYFGAWEFWRQLQQCNYDSEEELALSFLAAVDLAFNGDITATPTESLPLERVFENTIVPYRFGILASRINNVEPLHYHDDDISESVTHFQERICAANNWPPPVWGAEVMAASLTLYLIYSNPELLSRYTSSTINLNRIKAIFSRSPQENAQNLTDLEPIWAALNEGINSDNGERKIGSAIVANMLNACIYRIRHPGDFAVPHHSALRLTAWFPIPFILYKGNYMGEWPNFDARVGASLPFEIGSWQFAQDCLMLMAVLPVIEDTEKDVPRCGMIKAVTPKIQEAQCSYTSIGAGCPLIGLNERERKIREKLDLDEFCHWLFASIYLDLFEQNEAKRWRERWEKSRDR